MLAICSGNRYIVVLGCVIQYSLGENTFSGRQSPRVIISFSNTGGGRQRSSWADDRRPQVSCEHTILLEDTSLTPRIICFTSFHTQR